MVCHMGIHQLLDLLRKLSRLYLLFQFPDGGWHLDGSVEYRIGLYIIFFTSFRQIGNRCPVVFGNIDIADLAGQSAECLDQLDTFLP